MNVFSFALLVMLIPLMALLLVVALVWVVLRALTGQHPVRRNHRQDAEEARLMQELHHSMARLEERIENLETIVIERERHTSDARTE